MAISSLTLVASGLLIVAFVLVVAAGLDMTWLLATTPVLRRSKDLGRFRRAVSRQMYAALGVLGLGIGTAVAIGIGLVSGGVPRAELPLVLGAGVPFLVVEWWVKYMKARVKAVPVTDPVIRAKWDRVVRAWEDKAVPDW